MLETLRVRNFGAVDDVVIELDGGLTVLTGETGAGKTLLIEALHLVLGGKDRSLPSRDAAAPSIVEAVFADGDGEVVLARERTAQGRLRASIDGATASAQLLAARGEPLCQLHGQHEHLVLRTPDAARALLDRSGSIDDAHVRSLRAERRTLLAQRELLGGTAAERRRRIDLVAHEVAEIDAAAPVGPDEVDRLLVEVASLASTIDAKEALARAAEAIESDADEASAAGLMSAALAELPREVGEVRDELAELVERARGLAARLRRDLEALQDDPDRLDHLNDRIARLQGLVRKHGLTLGDVLARRDELAVELEGLRADDERSVALDGQLAAVEAALEEAESEVNARRHVAAASLSDGVRARLGPLALAHARFEVLVEGPAGERVSFRFAGSEAFEPAPLAEAASGGELSRVMLALTLASNAGAETMVFDEVDAGVGGVTARSLAACLAEVATSRQVVVVTHLATVAAAAAHHIVVTKPEAPGDPATVQAVSGAARVAEVARMLAGDPTDPVAITHAEALLAGDPAAS